ncbi:GrpB family protein [Pseudobacteriovorax antillogorgiicola]|uniref:GrpB domain, predicted nucleotidyltransferase, UPF0157 family n=1 Tax=Pseudobacteriovorax antillogorgiicola TaxID=1513793 RepID=A0A1Y6CPT1_9BACT|nr:GrpB family protein [Pseudobacteriovorax antillogorgiicola]TCS42739.1 GrpB-like predicted nucleotidyltransferase (UPF0157 family) [Pseudobacteriovorax antillogorgiicola]SMF82197.1 GrpB domain, predicted nucleotidyltransferase, UPF0157 family [Pseudobacteriovorax antillogorgiicola]
MVFMNYDEYSAKNHLLFSKLKVEIELVLPSAKVEHIGSSSILGAISKGDLDIFVGVDPGSFNRSLAAIQELDFRIKEDTLRTSDLCMLEHNTLSDVAIQLVSLGSEFDFFVSFRDALRQHPKLLHEYNSLKLDHSGSDVSTYRRAKSSFIAKVLQAHSKDKEQI